MIEHFTYEELCITGDTLPIEVATKLLKYHILPMQKVNEWFWTVVKVSLKSGYRPVSWELSQGRSGMSEHTFSGKGAVDWTCYDFEFNKDCLLEGIIEKTNYNRIAMYKGFIHCDYKETLSGNRELYKSTPNSVWTLDREI